MSTTIRVSEQTKEHLERLKREDESFDDLLRRIARENDSMNPGVWSSEQADAARERLRESRESFERGR